MTTTQCILKRDSLRYWIAHFKKGDQITTRVVGTPNDDHHHAIAHVSRHWDIDVLKIHMDNGSVIVRTSDK